MLVGIIIARPFELFDLSARQFAIKLHVRIYGMQGILQFVGDAYIRHTENINNVY